MGENGAEPEAEGKLKVKNQSAKLRRPFGQLVQ
jgi:hypothetical protein